MRSLFKKNESGLSKPMKKSLGKGKNCSFADDLAGNSPDASYSRLMTTMVVSS